MNRRRRRWKRDGEGEAVGAALKLRNVEVVAATDSAAIVTTMDKREREEEEVSLDLWWFYYLPGSKIRRSVRLVT